MGHPFFIRVRSRDTITILDVKGSITGTWALILGTRLQNIREEGIQKLIINFREVDSIDSIGMTVLNKAVVGGFNICAVHPPSRDMEMILKQVGLIVYACENLALDAIRGSPPRFQDRRRYPRIKTQIPAMVSTPAETFRGVIVNGHLKVYQFWSWKSVPVGGMPRG